MELVNKTTEKEYKEFLEKHERCHFQQSIEWAKIKSNWKNDIILVRNKENKIIGSISILTRKIPLFGNLMYAPRGPICDIHDRNVLSKLTDGIKELGKEYKAFTFKFEPDVIVQDEEFKKIMIELGYTIKNKEKNFDEEIQPKKVFRLSLKGKTEDEIFQGFHSKHRNMVRAAIKRGAEVRVGTRSDLPTFQKIMEETGERDSFIIRKLDYFEKIYDTLGEKHIKLLMAYHEDKPIAGTLIAIYGNKAWYMYAASSNEDRELMPNYLLQWELIKMLLAMKIEIYDFRGIGGAHENEGLYRFKSRFGGEFIEFFELYKHFSKIRYTLYVKSEKLFKKLRSLIFKLKKQTN